MGWLNKFNGQNASLEKYFTKLDKLYDEVIQQHLDPERPKLEHEDLVDLLFQIQKNSCQGMITLTNEQIKGVLTDVFIAGTNTSSATLVWIMTELVRNPRVTRRAQNEIREVAKGKRGGRK
ncbi:cytochrome P450 71A9-like [Pistacia vera]|uniref:cytochrome P450 71A9-like n=1 Tax=Pistacia vera TaxID=55513 RepID=UPI001263939D|nr:cytochrome P450 71A9-like [Pistacia vera]